MGDMFRKREKLKWFSELFKVVKLEIGLQPRFHFLQRVCFRSSCCNKLSQSGWLKKHLFLAVLEATKSKIKMLTDLVSGKGPHPDLQIVENMIISLISLLIEAPSPLMMAPPNNLVTSQTSHLLTPSHQDYGVRV